MFEDSVHYLSQLMWVLGNMLWALGNIVVYKNGDDDPQYFLNIGISDKHLRYYAAWVLFAAYWPIILLYCIWIPLTFTGGFTKHRESEMRSQERDVESEEKTGKESVRNNPLHSQEI